MIHPMNSPQLFLILQQLFLELIQHASKLDGATIHRIISLSRKSGWNIGDLIQSLEPSGSGSNIYADFQSLEEKLKKGNARSSNKKTQELLDEQDMRSLVSSSGLMAQSFPGFEYRPQQESMVLAVTKALNEGRHLIGEGATGVGKSIAYLLPSMLYAAKNDVKVVDIAQNLGSVNFYNWTVPTNLSFASLFISIGMPSFIG